MTPVDGCLFVFQMYPKHVYKKLQENEYWKFIHMTNEVLAASQQLATEAGHAQTTLFRVVRQASFDEGQKMLDEIKGQKGEEKGENKTTTDQGLLAKRTERQRRYKLYLPAFKKSVFAHTRY